MHNHNLDPGAKTSSGLTACDRSRAVHDIADPSHGRQVRRRRQP